CDSWLKKHPRGEHEPLLAELARLSRFEYDRRRKAEAKRLGIQLSTLDREVAELRAQAASEKGFLPHWSVEPWPEQVDGEPLLDALRAQPDSGLCVTQLGREDGTSQAASGQTASHQTASPNVLAKSPRSTPPFVRRFINHSFRVANLARRHGWLPGARYTNLRDIRRFERLGFLDIDWKNYSFKRHLSAARSTNPMLTVARDIENIDDLWQTLDEAHELRRYANDVIIVPKDPRLGDRLDEAIPPEFLLGFNVPTRYGGTLIPTAAFRRPVHLLGGRPDVQRRLASVLPVVSIDCNRFTLDASFGDYFDGGCFRPHPQGGYIDVSRHRLGTSTSSGSTMTSR
ncbi:MAG TPA: DUF6610 family protein, partial [Pseudolabrys sp.]|nr:DUF6610 family protein [Pseudolabrys sp.]